MNIGSIFIVSIPYRYSSNKIVLTYLSNQAGPFQFLIGILATDLVVVDKAWLEGFQFLIGILATATILLLFSSPELMFQFLIGILATIFLVEGFCVHILFQFLIGILATRYPPSIDLEEFQFQFLIGILATENNKDQGRD